jgi:hypothetical protein
MHVKFYHRMNQGLSSPGSDVSPYAIIKKLQHSIFNILVFHMLVGNSNIWG